MFDNVIRICDYERRSKNPDAVQPRDPCEADVIALPVVRTERNGSEVEGYLFNDTLSFPFSIWRL